LGGYNTRTTDLAAGASYTVSTTFISSTSALPGTRTLFVKTDGLGGVLGGSNTDSGKVVEASESNNLQTTAIQLPGADLTVSNLAIGAITENQNGSYNIPVTFKVDNVGTVAAQAPWYDYGYLSTDTILNDTDQVLGGFNPRNADLAAGASYTVSRTFTTSAATAPGTYTLIVKADGGASASGPNSPTGRNHVAEVNETNNTQSASITLPTKPDLTVSIVGVGAIAKNANGSYSIPLRYTVTNTGGTAAAPNWYDVAYLSIDGLLDNGDAALIGYHQQTVALAAGASYTINGTFTTATTTTPGRYTLFVKADGRWSGVGGTPTDVGYVVEVSETNNAASTTVVLP